MRYVDFRDTIDDALRKNPSGMTWRELKEKLDLPYKAPCPEWVARLEREIGLTRIPGEGRAYIWKVRKDSRKKY